MTIKFDKPTNYHGKNLITRLDMLVDSNGLHSTALCQLKTDLDYQRRLQGVFNVLFGVTVGVLVVMVWRFA